MVEIVAFAPEHLIALRLQGAQASLQPFLTLEHGQQIAACPGMAQTALLDGAPIACAGMIELWPNRACAWSYLSDTALKHIRAIHRAVIAALKAARWRRIEMSVDVRHTAAKRWAWHLGFDVEGTARAYTPDGRDCEIWARVR